MAGSEELRCAHCQRALGSRFEITRYTRDNEKKGALNVCSLICMVQWSYGAAVSHGVQGVMAIKDTLGNLGAMLRGGRR